MGEVEVEVEVESLGSTKGCEPINVLGRATNFLFPAHLSSLSPITCYTSTLSPVSPYI
jgi:hypothetical protein